MATPHRLTIKYRELPRWKYSLECVLEIPTGIRGGQRFELDLCLLDEDGVLIVNPKYAWDGPSGPTIDTANWMRASLAHDALYQLMREAGLDISHRKAADQLMYDMLREDGMSWVRARVAYRGVRLFGKPAAKPRKPAPVLSAP